MDFVSIKTGATTLRDLPFFSNDKIRVFAKLEFENPLSESVKDRIAEFMLEQAIKRGDLKPGMSVVECTSGNTGAALAAACKKLGYKLFLTCPDKVSTEKVERLRKMGAQVHVCPTSVPAEDQRSYYSVAKRLAKENNGYCPDQYNNPDNPLAHYNITGPEIYRDFEKLQIPLHAFVAGMGTGGTISGIARYLKEKNPQIKVVGIDPIGSIYAPYFMQRRVFQGKDKNKVSEELAKNFRGYKVEGIGEDFLCNAIDFNLIDDVISISDAEAFASARMLEKFEKVSAGGSSGAALAGVVLHQEVFSSQKDSRLNICILFPDSGKMYGSKFYNSEWLKEHCEKAFELEKRIQLAVKR